MAVALVGVRIEVVLVIRLGFIELTIFDSGDYLVVKLWVELGDGLFSDFLLLLILREYDAAILGAHIRTLAVKLGRIVNGKKDLQKLFVTYNIRNELYLYYFRTLRHSCADLLVGGIFASASSISAYYLFDAFDPLKYRFKAPKTPAPKDCHLTHRASFLSPRSFWCEDSRYRYRKA